MVLIHAGREELNGGGASQERSLTGGFREAFVDGRNSEVSRNQTAKRGRLGLVLDRSRKQYPARDTHPREHFRV